MVETLDERLEDNWDEKLEKLREWKIEQKLTTNEMAKGTGIPVSSMEKFLAKIRKPNEGGRIRLYRFTGLTCLEKEEDMILKDIILETPYKGEDGKPIRRLGLSDLYVDRLNYLFCGAIGNGELNNNLEYGRVTKYSKNSPVGLLNDLAYISVTSLMTVDYGRIVGTKSKKFEKELKDAHIFGVVNARICKIPKDKEEVDKVYDDEHPFKKRGDLIKSPFIKPEGFVSLDQYLEEDPSLSKDIPRDKPPMTQSVHVISSTDEAEEFVYGVKSKVGEKYKGQTKVLTSSILEEIMGDSIRGVADRIRYLTGARVEPRPEIEGFNLYEKFPGLKYSVVKIKIPGVVDDLRSEYIKKVRAKRKEYR